LLSAGGAASAAVCGLVGAAVDCAALNASSVLRVCVGEGQHGGQWSVGAAHNLQGCCCMCTRAPPPTSYLCSSHAADSHEARECGDRHAADVLCAALCVVYVARCCQVGAAKL
jgi:hypothetical protein